MLQALLAGGAMFQGLKAEIGARAQRLGFMIACAVVALLFLSVGLSALGIAVFILIQPALGSAGAAAAVGAGALVIGGIIMMVAARKQTATAATTAAPATPSATAFPGLANATGQAPVPWLLGALALGLVLGKKS